jgi:hypothetical protein
MSNKYGIVAFTRDEVEKYEKAQKKLWIIGKSGSEWDDVITYIVEGTDYQVKSLLASFCKDDSTEDDFDYGDTKISDVRMKGDHGYYAGSTFYDHHNDYTATPLMEPITVKEAKEMW